MSFTDAISKQKAFIPMAGFHSLTDKVVLGIFMWPFRKVFLKTVKSAP